MISAAKVGVEEETPRALTNLPDTPAGSTPPPKGGSGIPAQNGSIARPEGDEARGDAAPTLAAELPPTEITRATTRFQVQIDHKTAEGKALLRQLDEACQLVATAKNAVARWCWRRDSAYIDAYLSERSELPWKKPEWPKVPKAMDEGGDAYALTGRVCPMLDGGIRSAVTRDVIGKWIETRYDVLIRQRAAPFHYKPTQPIPIRRQEVKFVPGGIELRLFMRREGGERLTLPFTPRDARQRREMEALRSGEWRCRSAALVRDRLRPSRWYLTVSYSRAVEAQTGGKVAAVTRGMRSFLVALVGDEAWIYDGHDIEAYLKQIQARRKLYQRSSKASSRDGRGRERMLQPIRILERKAYNWRQTKIATIARRLARWLVDRGVTEVVREDFSGIRDALPEALAVAEGSEERGQYIWERVQEWPYYQMGVALDNALADLGVVDQEGKAPNVRIVPAAWNAQTCPRCDRRGEGVEVDRKHWRLRCECGWKRHLDVTQCANLLRRARGEVVGEPPSALAIQKRGKQRAKARRDGRTPPDMLAGEGGAREADGNGVKGDGNGESGGKG